MREHTQSAAPMEATNSARLSAICQTGGVSTTTRANINIGAKKGTRDIHTAKLACGCRRTAVIMTTGITIGKVTNICHCCASWSELTIAPRVAYSVLKSRNPRGKKTRKEPETKGLIY